MDTQISPVSREELRVGGIVLTIGGVGGFVANIFHPDPPGEIDALVRLLLLHPHWSQLHFLIMISVALSVSGLAILTHNLADPMARALGTLGRYLVILGGSVYMVEVMIDGFATRYFARHWAEATDPVQKASYFTSADTAAHVWGSLFPVFSGVFLGLACLVIGAAVARSGNIPRWVGWWGVVSGTLCFITGVGSGLRIPPPLPVWIVGVSMSAAWGLMLGPMTWRAGREPKNSS